jgi:hypothetical protein
MLANKMEVICTLLARDGTWLQSQLNLLSSGLKVGVKRFAPAEFGCGPSASLRVALLASQTPIWDACRKAKNENPGFEWAIFSLGLFMNYLGNGCANETEALAGKSDDGEAIFFMKDLKADIPTGEGGKIPRLTLTEMGDVGKFVAAACDLPQGQWREDFEMAGETLRMDQVVELIEKVRGKKMAVTYRSVEQIREELKNTDDFLKVFWLELDLVYVADLEGECIMRPVLNELCPQVKPMRLEEYLRKFWSGQ